MKRNNKKGFTIVELVIVIAVIAILSAVLIPTFGGVIERAQESAAKQEAKNAHTAYIASLKYEDGDEAETIYVVTDNGVYTVSANGEIAESNVAETALADAKQYDAVDLDGVQNDVYVVHVHVYDQADDKCVCGTAKP